MKRKRIGSSAVVLALCGVMLSAGQKKPAVNLSALLEGTVFREPGFALPGAEVVATSLPEPGAAAKPERLKTLTSERGEFVIHVAPVEMHYKLTVSAKGYQSQEKTVEVRGEERVDATFLLAEESKK